MTGAAGFLGAPLVRHLLKAGSSVRVLVRTPARGEEAAALGAEVVVGDVTDPNAARRAVDGVAVVYHLAGKLLVPGVPDSDYRVTHVDGTQVLLEACLREPRLERFVHCSTTGVLGVTGEHPADETAPIRPTNIYESTKAEAERRVRDALRNGLPAVIVRPGLVYGPGDLHLLGFFCSVLRRQFRPIGRRPTWLHPMYIDDMTDALALCGRHPAAVGECFHIAAKQPVTLAGFAAAIAEAAGIRPPAGYIPIPVARVIAAIGDVLPASLKRSAPLTANRLDFLTHSRVYNVEAATLKLGFTAKTDIAEGIGRTLEWYRRNAYLPLPSRAAQQGLVGTVTGSR